MTKTLDARGLACPAPVLMTKDAVEKNNPEILSVLVDNEAASENVARFLESRGFTVDTTQEGHNYTVCGRGQNGSPVKPSAPDELSKTSTSVQKPKIMVLIATDRLGFGDDKLGKKLIVSFIKTIKEMGDELWRLVFVNNGVKLTTDGSPVLEDLIAYENDGLSILVCGTCLTHLDLLEAKRVGKTTNMLDIVTAMQLADKVINI